MAGVDTLYIKEINDQKIQNFLYNIKYLRAYYSLSKKKMAEIMGVSITTINKIESGVMPKRLNAENLIKLADFFLISIDMLFEELKPED